MTGHAHEVTVMADAATPLLTLEDAAERVHVSVKTVRRYIASGKLTGYRVGPTLIRLDAAEVDKLLRPITTVRRSAPQPLEERPETNAETIARLGLKPGVLTPLPSRTPEQKVEDIRWVADLIEARDTGPLTSL